MLDRLRQYPVLTLDQALMRLTVVLFIEFVGSVGTVLLVWYGPRLSSPTDWQLDCLKGIGIFGGASLGMLILVLCCAIIVPRIPNISEKVVSPLPKLTEGIIWLVFGLNTVFFALGMARTGGPSQSFFAQLVPIQLSGILVLQHQKVMISQIPATVWTFATFAFFSVLAWVLGAYEPEHFVRIVGWNKLMTEGKLDDFFVFATTALFVLSVVVTVLAYWLPLQKWFKAMFQSPVSNLSN